MREGTPYEQYDKACGTFSVMVFARSGEDVGQFAQPQAMAARTKDICLELGIETRHMKFGKMGSMACATQYGAPLGTTHYGFEPLLEEEERRSSVGGGVRTCNSSGTIYPSCPAHLTHTHIAFIAPRVPA